ncbi:n-acetylmuramoyl-L-alanine amidase [Geoanaerobacter pelophilus]|uniref:N-acetylmuramoyl-L-alanine amidase n=1 Tax=Geoanaerobacter pelophilus TaxID=60036 RepID=A0ABQ0MFR3_9BACT|nr:N-acetylmuramoyl-L-alanine amidase [Geoanaerobacter pelophilus]GAW65940.1 n-acetylmuramoyl-L-alanine amidase [Geoanaerobacter pelophilus]
MDRRDFVKYLGLSLPYYQWLSCRMLAAQGSLLLTPFLSAQSHAASQALVPVTELKHWSTPDYTRIAITARSELPYEHHKLPNRLYLDLQGAKLNPGVKDLSIGDGLLKSVRIAQFQASTVRVVLDLDSIKDYKVFTFSDPFRIIIDVKGDRRQEISSSKEVIETAQPEPKPVEKPKSSGKFKPGKIRRIVIDPGHGGHDPGAVSPSGTREKDIVLQIGLKLAQKVREELGIDAVMTRSTDVFLELQERTAIANKVGADLFVSVHANASLNRGANGIETYYLNLAKTEKAAQLAAKENGTSLEKVSMLQAVLFDLMANYKLNDSAHLADEVQKALFKKAQTGYATVKNLGVKQGPFYVLVGATMPSILVETAFLSNDRDEQKLKEPQYQDLTADGILSGIKGYITSLNKIHAG